MVGGKVDKTFMFLIWFACLVNVLRTGLGGGGAGNSEEYSRAAGRPGGCLTGWCGEDSADARHRQQVRQLLTCMGLLKCICHMQIHTNTG